MIRILLVDDHPAVRAGLQTVIEREGGLVAAGAAASEHELWPMLYRVRPDVADGERVLPELSAQTMSRAAELVAVEDRPVLAMCLSGSPPCDIAQTLRVAPEDLAHRVDRILGRLRVGVSASAA